MRKLKYSKSFKNTGLLSRPLYEYSQPKGHFHTLDRFLRPTTKLSTTQSRTTAAENSTNASISTDIYKYHRAIRGHNANTHKETWPSLRSSKHQHTTQQLNLNLWNFSYSHYTASLSKKNKHLQCQKYIPNQVLKSFQIGAVKTVTVNLRHQSLWQRKTMITRYFSSKQLITKSDCQVQYHSNYSHYSRSQTIL